MPAGSSNETEKLRNLGYGFLVGGWLIGLVNVAGGILTGNLLVGIFGGWIAVSIGFALRGLFGSLANIDDNVRELALNVAADTASRPVPDGAAYDPRPRISEAHPATDVDPPAAIFQGSKVVDIQPGAFGASWGKTETGELVFREEGQDEWRIYQKGATPLVPPANYRS